MGNLGERLVSGKIVCLVLGRPILKYVQDVHVEVMLEVQLAKADGFSYR